MEICSGGEDKAENGEKNVGGGAGGREEEKEGQGEGQGGTGGGTGERWRGRGRWGWRKGGEGREEGRSEVEGDVALHEEAGG
ncbi:MAG: hypothetical protein II151_06815, partial [Bacteroidales bacterium]|nr:hypothetical protein [Bacteroidales bacterium]